MVYRIYVGSYTNEITTLSFDPNASSLSVQSSLTVGFQPSWITPHPKDQSLVFTGLEQSNGQIVAVKFDQKGHGTIVGSSPSGGADPCNLVAVGSDLFIANVCVALTRELNAFSSILLTVFCWDPGVDTFGASGAVLDSYRICQFQARWNGS